MVKLQVDDIIIRYKNVVDLHRKIYRALEKIRAKQTRLESQMKLLRKKERTLKRFLGLRQKNADMVPYEIQTVNS